MSPGSRNADLLVLESDWGEDLVDCTSTMPFLQGLANALDRQQARLPKRRARSAKPTSTRRPHLAAARARRPERQFKSTQSLGWIAGFLAQLPASSGSQNADPSA